MRRVERFHEVLCLGDVERIQRNAHNRPYRHGRRLLSEQLPMGDAEDSSE